jgi:peptidoglycan/xylan/chitin deacetylase (PgdA/CDA1 family)
MLVNAALLSAALAVCATAIPIENPLEFIKRAGPATGVTYTKCSQPGMLALAYDDGPYQYTQQLVNTLNSGGAKGTFFVTGTLYGKSDTGLLHGTR